MKAEDKAKELVDKFDLSDSRYDMRNSAVEHALICVDEFLNMNYPDSLNINQVNEVHNYWQSVKEHIKQM